MAIELKVPTVGESITEVEIGEWLKAQGQRIGKDEVVVTLESEKATVELPAPAEGMLTQILKQKGQTALVGEVIAMMEPGTAPVGKSKGGDKKPAETDSQTMTAGARETRAEARRVMPAAERLMSEHNLKPGEVEGTGPGGRVLKEDVLRQVDKAKTTGKEMPSAEPGPAAPRAESTSPAPPVVARDTGSVTGELPPPLPANRQGREEEVVAMSRLRRTVAERLVQAQHTAALLTTFNEIDMSNVIALRAEHGEAFLKRYEVKLGFMSFFVKACVDALRQYPVLNAEVRETNMVYHNYYDIGVAVGSGKGLVVPVLRNVELMSFAQIEKTIGDFAKRAKENKLKLDELQGGTFTISNGGVYGSMLSTPIVNPPQSGVLGMHAIQDRPVARDGAVVIRPIMFVALTYDHRVVDGREAVSFLRRIKEVIENPTRMLMEI